MFKEDKSMINPNNFGVGSIVNAFPEKYVLIQNSKKDSVQFLSLEDFSLKGDCNIVGDVNHLKESEARLLIDSLNLQMTFADFGLIPKGLKDYA